MRASISFLLFVALQLSASSAEPPGWFKRLDRDRNGTLNETEASRFFKPMDADGDSKITVDEGIAFMKKRNRGARNKNAPRGGERRGPLRSAEETKTRKKTGNGLWVVSIGHSCVVPAVVPFSKIVIGDGYDNHTHLMQFFGAVGGAALAQWKRVEGGSPANRSPKNVFPSGDSSHPPADEFSATCGLVGNGGICCGKLRVCACRVRAVLARQMARASSRQ